MRILGSFRGRRLVAFHATVAVAVLAGACSATSTDHCVPGYQVACSCVGGGKGVQVCLDDGKYGACQCSAADSGAQKDTGGQGGAAGSSAGGSMSDAYRGSGGAWGTSELDAGRDSVGVPVATGGTGPTGTGGVPENLDARGDSASTSGGGGSNAGRDAPGGLDSGIDATRDGVVDSTITVDTPALGDASTIDGGAKASTELARGTGGLIGLFVGAAGIYLVTTDAVVLIDRNGNPLARASIATSAKSAAFDGAQLVVTEQGRFTTFDMRLATIGSGDLLEPCASSILISNNRFVCGPGNDWDRVFYTYDTRSGRFVASSKKYTYNGIPMTRIPGTDDFVTVTTDVSPSDFHLYSVLSSGEVTYINESPYHGDFPVTALYAFDGAPPAHLVTGTGLLLKIRGTNCTANASSFTSECFIQDGTLPTVTGNQTFLGMDSDQAGIVYGLVATSDTSGSPSCTPGCYLESFDVSRQAVLTQTIVRLTMNYTIAFRHDPIGNAAVVAYRTTFTTDGGYVDGYSVLALPY